MCFTVKIFEHTKKEELIFKANIVKLRVSIDQEHNLSKISYIMNNI
jgi:hypothetical protein